MPRYRLFVDVIDAKGLLDTQGVNDIIAELRDKTALAVTGEQKRQGISLELIGSQAYTAAGFHHHIGADCRGCYRQAEDGLSE